MNIKGQIIPAILKENKLLVWVSLGILLRLLLMPFFSHVDLYSEFRRVVYSIENDIFFPQQNRLVTFYIEYGFLKFFYPLLKDPSTIFFLESLSKSTSNLTDYFIFIQHEGVFRHLFLFKLPYLICDVLTMWVIWCFFDDKNRARIAVLIWVFNPITLYATYFFGRYEAISILFIALTILMLKKDKAISAAICLSLALNSREIYVVTVPIFLIALYREDLRIWQNVKKIFIPALIIVVSILLPYLLEKALHLTPIFSQGAVYEDDKANALYSMAYQWFYPLVFAYGSLILIYFVQPFQSNEYKFIAGSGLMIASYFVLTSHSAHYVAWLPLFPILLLNYPKEIRPLLIAIFALFASWFIYRIFKADVNLFSLFLAAPLNFEFIFIDNVQQIYSKWVGDTKSIFAYGKVLNAFRTLFATTLIFLMYQMYQTRFISSEVQNK